jgi:hypothetical protein
MHDSIVDMLNIGKNLVPGVRVLIILHMQDVHDHLVDDLRLEIHLGVEGGGLGELGVHQ